jgi:4-amino-4-deoxy-L-arabinose transferase-like glycosyltransferase
MRRREMSGGRGIAAIDVPVAGGTLVLLAALLRFDFWPAAIAVIGGLLAGPVLSAATRRAPGWQGLLQQGWRNERVFLALVFLLAFGLRILYLLRVMTDPNYVATGGDGAVYDDLAWSIAQGHGVSERFQNAYPLLLLGYVRLVAAIYALVGHSYFAVGAVQSAFGAATCVMLYIIAKPLLGVPVARLAAVFTALSFPLLFAAAAIGHQAIDVFLMALLIWLLARAFEHRSTGLWRWAAIGVVLGYAVAVRETNAFFLALIVIWMAVVFRPSGTPAVIRAVGALVAGTAVVLLPLLVPMVSSAESRMRLRVHFDRLYTGQGDAIRTRDELAGPLSDPGAALEQLREEPAFVVNTIGRAIVHNFAVQFFTQPFGGFDLVFLAKGSKYYYAMWFYAYALAGAGIVLAARRVGADPGSSIIVLIFGLIVARTLPHLILESHYRHRVPIEPFLILLASLAAVTLCQAVRAREFQGASPA